MLKPFNGQGNIFGNFIDHKKEEKWTKSQM